MLHLLELVKRHFASTPFLRSLNHLRTGSAGFAGKKLSEASECSKTIYSGHFCELLSIFIYFNRFKPVYTSLRWFTPFHGASSTFHASYLSQNQFVWSLNYIQTTSWYKYHFTTELECLWGSAVLYNVVFRALLEV